MTERTEGDGASDDRKITEQSDKGLQAIADQSSKLPAGFGLGSRIARRFAGLGLTDHFPEVRGETFEA